ncbi:type 2 DNA topoisomerase 6 subunit B-like isoform X2 [Ambystoma mexicanum]|uniref:type 2 DNA topoisomerase 6 subunit B-like isoform X2 n=1 Tax=Ambystoma mexicanum TaxID=8296 RepID=UPI0037E941C2
MDDIVYTIFEYLIVHMKCKDGKQSTNCLEGTLFISMNAENSRRDVNQHCCFTTIAGAGDLSTNMNENLHKEITVMLTNHSIELIAVQKEVRCLHEHVGFAPFHLAFEIHQNSKKLMLECIGIKQYLHRISVVNPKVKVHYCIQVNGTISTETYKSEGQGGNLHCTRIHPVHGRANSLLIPNHMAEMGLSGELQLVPIAALCPCSKTQPNQPSQISTVSIFLYSTLGLPVRRKSLSFFEETFHVTEWEMFNNTVAVNLDIVHEEDDLVPDINYKIGDISEQHDSLDIIHQTVLLFLFLDYSDRFQSELEDVLSAHRMIVCHTDHIFQCNQSILTEAIQSVLKMTLEKRNTAERNQGKLQLAHTVVIDSIYSIVKNSTNSSFRRQCFNHFQVLDAQELKVAVRTSLHKTSLNRVLMSQTCDIKTRNKQNVPSESAYPASSQSLSPGHSQSKICTGPSGNRDDLFEEQIPHENIHKRKRAAQYEHMVNLHGEHASHFEPDVLLSCSDSGPPRGSQNQSPVDSEKQQEDSMENPDQDDDGWFQEVSNLSNWAC